MNGIFDDLKNAFRRPDNALLQLIIINVIVFLSLQIIGVTFGFIFKTPLTESFVDILEDQFILPPYLSQLIFRPWTVLSYAFNHDGFLHILGNMLGLYWFGLIIVEYLGSRRLISLYVLGALAGAISFILLNLLINRPTDGMVGASGAVFCVMVGAATLTPNYTFHLILLGPVRIKYIAAVFIVLSYIGLGSNTGGNLAHLVGAFLGYMYIVQLNKGTDLGKWIHDFTEFVGGLFRKKSKLRVSHNKRRSKVTTNAGYQNGKRNSNEHTPDQNEIDAILDKISESGYDSLTKEEKQKLFRASKS